MRLWRRGRQVATPQGPTAHDLLDEARERLERVQVELDEAVASEDQARRRLLELANSDPESYRELCYRQRFPMTHEEYLDEPAEFVDWALAYWSAASAT